MAGLLVYFLWQQAAVRTPESRRLCGDRPWMVLVCAPLPLVLGATLMHSNWIWPASQMGVEFRWSPYYRLDYYPAPRHISVNLIGHQAMHDKDYVSPEYALPHLLQRDALAKLGQAAAALRGRADHRRRQRQRREPRPRVGRQAHRRRRDRSGDPEARRTRPPAAAVLDDPRVTVHLDDGRNFLRSTQKKYDLVIYALVDSLVLHSSYSNIRLESYLFTRQAFEDIQRCLKPNGLFITYNYFRQGWIVARLVSTLEGVFGKDTCFVFAWPFRSVIPSEEAFDGFGVVFAGPGAAMLRQTFPPDGEYWLPTAPPDAAAPNGFDSFERESEKLAGASITARQGALEGWWRFAPVKVLFPAEPIVQTTDDWPLLYVREPMLPMRPVISGMLVMGVIAASLIFLVLREPAAIGPAKGTRGWNFDTRMFLLGAGFMLIETKAVVNMALLFGSTWIVNSVVFFAVLVMILLANLFVLRVRPEKLWPYYAVLFVTLAINTIVPLDVFLGWPRGLQIAASCLLVFAPIALAGVVFATAFGRTAHPDSALGANIAGAMLGGLAENFSMLIGFQYLGLVALAFYALSMRGEVSGQTPSALADR